MLYKKLTFADSPFTFTSAILSAINANQNSLVMDFDTTGGNIIVNLPSINSLLFASNTNASTVSGVGGGGMSFFMRANILTGGHNVTVVAASGDDVCGVASASIGLNRNGSCFHVFIAGLHRWAFLSCINT